MSQADVKDRRIHPRIVVSWPVRLWNEDEVLVGRTIDVSEQGLCIVTAPTEALNRGDSYRVELMVGPSAQVACTGEIRHVTSSELNSLIGIRTRETDAPGVASGSFTPGLTRRRDQADVSGT